MWRFNKYQAHLLLFSTCITTIPIILLGFIFYFKEAQSIQQKVDEGNQHILEQTRLRVEQVLEAVDVSLQKLAASKSVDQSLSEDLAPSSFQFVLDLSQSMYQLQTFNLGVQDVDLINLRNNWILSNYGLQRISSIQNKDRIQEYANLSTNSFWTSEISTLAKNKNYLKEIDYFLLQDSIFILKKILESTYNIFTKK